MLGVYPSASSIKSVTGLKNCCLCGINPVPQAAGFVSAALPCSHCAPAHLSCIPMAPASISAVPQLKLAAFAQLARPDVQWHLHWILAGCAEIPVDPWSCQCERLCAACPQLQSCVRLSFAPLPLWPEEQFKGGVTPPASWWHAGSGSLSHLNQKRGHFVLPEVTYPNSSHR